MSSAVGSPFLTLGHLQQKQLNRTLSGIPSVLHQKMKSAAPNEVGVSLLTQPEYTATGTASAGACTQCSQCYVVCWCELAAAVDVGYLPQLWGSDAQRCSYWSLWTCRTRHSQCERNIRCRQWVLGECFTLQIITCSTSALTTLPTPIKSLQSFQVK